MTMGRTLGALGALVALVLVSCDRGPVLASPPPAGPFVSGSPVFEANGWIEYIPGDAPLIIVAPMADARGHSGSPSESAKPATTETTRTRWNSRVSLPIPSPRERVIVRIWCSILLDPSKFDANRDMLEATAGNHALELTWNWA